MRYIPAEWKNIIRVFLSRLKIFLIIAVILGAIGILPEVYISTTLDKGKIEKLISGKLKASNLAIAYTGVSISFYRGITIHNLRISNENDFSMGNTLFRADEVHWNVPLDYYFHQNQTPIFRLSTRKPKISLWIRNDALSGGFMNQLFDWKKNPGLDMVMEDASVVFNVKGQSGEKSIHEFHFKEIILKSGSQIQISGKYDNTEFGDGEIEIQPGLKNSRYPFTGIYRWKGNDLPLHLLNPFLLEYKMNGTYSGEWKIAYSVDFPIKNKTPEKKIFDISLDYSLKNFQVDSRRWGYLPVNTASGKEKIRIIRDKDKEIFSSDGTGVFGRYHYNLKTLIHDERLMPDVIDLDLKARNKDDRILILPDSIILQGMDHFSLKIYGAEKNQQYSPYRNWDATLRITNGEIKFPLTIEKDKTTDIEYLIPSFNLDVKKNNYKLSGSIRTKQENPSDLSLQMEGFFIPSHSMYAYRKKIEGYRSVAESRGFTISWRNNNKGALSAKNLNHSDVLVWTNYFRQTWKLRLMETMNDRDLPGSLIYTDWYYRYFQIFSADIGIRIDQWITGKDIHKNISGELKEKNRHLYVAIRDDRDNLLDASYNLGSANPNLEVDLYLNTMDGKHILGVWMDPRLVEDYHRLELNFHLNAYGVRASDIHASHNIRGNIHASGFIPGTQAPDSIRKKWDKMEAYFYYIASQSRISNISLENPSVVWSGKADFTDKKMGKPLLKPYWNFSGKLTNRETDTKNILQ